jgi:hypothetical protein
VHAVRQTRTLVAGAVGAIAASQTLGAAGALTINGTLASGGVATMAAQQQIGITSTANYSATNFTITGTDGYGRTISEVLAGPNNATKNSVLNYLTVTSIVSSTALATALTVDTIGAGASGEVTIDRYLNPVNVSLTVAITGTANVTAQYTTDDIFGGAPGPFTWFAAATTLTGITASASAAITVPVTAVRLLTNSGTGTAVFSVVQSGAVC